MQTDTPSIDENLLKQLPPVLRAVVKALGFSRAKEFLDTYGGVLVYVPKKQNAMFCLDTRETQRLLVLLEQHLDSSRRISFPKPDKLFIFARNLQIRIDKETCSITNLARKNKLTTRHIMNICRGDNSSPQFDLFVESD